MTFRLVSWTNELACVIALNALLACAADDEGGGPQAGAGGTTNGGSGGVSATGGGGASGDSTGGVGMAGDAGMGGAANDPPAPQIPDLLSEAGLYEADMETLASGVRPFRPQYQLWTDGATKRRFIWLPEGASIDTSDVDYWSYPVGTRLYKEFTRDGVRIETRLLQKQPSGAWWMMAYHWREDQTEADAVPDGVSNASNTEHDIPSTEDCRTCHLRLPDKVIGFSAIQLAHEAQPPDEAEWTLARLQTEGVLTHPTPALQLPGNETTRAALGYLHANCGHCHNPRSSVSSRISLDLWLRAGQLEEAADTPAYQSAVGQDVLLTSEGPEGYPVLVDPGAPEQSALFVRFTSRGESYSMPPLGTELVDTSARDLLEEWIEAL